MFRPLEQTVAAGRCAAGVLALVLAAPCVAQFVPNEKLVSPNPALIDLEFSAARAKFAWTDPRGNLWLADVDRDTGAFSPISGQGQKIATGTVAKFNMFLWNGPEWISMASGDQVYFSYYLPGKAPVAKNTRMALAVQDAGGGWVVQPLGPATAPRMSDVASTTRGDPSAQVMYFDPDYNHYWRNVDDAASERLLPFLPKDDKAWRFVHGARAMLYAGPAEGVQQIFIHQLDSGVSEQLTFDSGSKDTGRTVPWMWPAPEFGNDPVLSTFVDGSELRIYRRQPTPAGSLQWVPIYSATMPPGRTAGSPQWFTYNGNSYLYWATYVSPDDFPSEIWLSNIDAANPIFRRISDDSPRRARNDPEHFITNQYGPLIYYNRYDPSVDPAHPLCSACSEGVYRADAGLRLP